MAQMRPITLLALTLLLSLATAAKPELPVKKVLTLEAAKKIAAAAEAEATKRKATVVIVVVDDGGHLLLLERLDDTQVASVEVGSAKREQRQFSAGRAKSLKIRFATVA